MLGEVVPAFERLREQGKTRFLGITAVGDTPALRQVIDAGDFDSAQVSYNMLNPSAGDGAAGRLSGAGLLPAVRAHAGGRRRRDRHPRAGRRRAVGVAESATGGRQPPPEPIGSALTTTRTWRGRGG